MVRVAVIADDLTGAADTGVQLVRAGYRTAVAFCGAPMPPARDVDALVADTDSRTLARGDAAARVMTVAALLRRAPLLYKKVDSTLRGNVATEVRAAFDGSGRTCAIVAPAFPAGGRTTRGGVQRIGGRPVATTVFADDPTWPVREAWLPRLLESAGMGTLVVLSREDVADASRVAAAVRAHACVVADAEDDADLAALVHAVPDPTEVLWVGSAGLAAALGAMHPGPRAPAPNVPASAASRGGVLVVIGSATRTARTQVSRIAALPDVTDVPLSLALLARDREEEAVRAAARAAAAAVTASATAVVHATAAEQANVEAAPDSAVEHTPASAPAPARPRLGPPESPAGPAFPRRSSSGQLSLRIPRALGAVAERVAQEGMVRGLVLSGGETAIHVARALGAHGLLIERELEPGVPVSRLLGRRTYPVVTKAGDFGGAGTLVEAVRALGGRFGAHAGSP